MYSRRPKENPAADAQRRGSRPQGPQEIVTIGAARATLRRLPCSGTRVTQRQTPRRPIGAGGGEERAGQARCPQHTRSEISNVRAATLRRARSAAHHFATATSPMRKGRNPSLRFCLTEIARLNAPRPRAARSEIDRRFFDTPYYVTRCATPMRCARPRIT